MRTFENFTLDRTRTSTVLNEGGAYGHLSHVFEDMELTFKDLEELIDLAVEGNLNRESPAVEKMDGINLMCTVIDGNLRIARNAGHIKNFGESSITPAELIAKYESMSELQEIFKDSVLTLEAVVKNVPRETLDKIFQNGACFMSVEIVNSKRPVSVPYYFDFLVVHDVFMYNQSGEPVSVDRDANRLLLDALAKGNVQLNTKYKVLGRRDVQLKKLDNFKELSEEFKNSLYDLRQRHNLTEDHMIVDYYRAELESILSSSFKFGPREQKYMNKVYDRIILGDKSYSLNQIKKDFAGNEKFINFMTYGEKNGNIKKIRASIIRPVEIIYTRLGVHVMKNTVGFINDKQSDIADRIKKEIQAAIESLKKDKDPKAIETLMINLERFDLAGGFESVLPTEGIVFTYKGKNYKFTGAFAAFHQLLSFYKF